MSLWDPPWYQANILNQKLTNLIPSQHYKPMVNYHDERACITNQRLTTLIKNDREPESGWLPLVWNVGLVSGWLTFGLLCWPGNRIVNLWFEMFTKPTLQTAGWLPRYQANVTNHRLTTLIQNLHYKPKHPDTKPIGIWVVPL
jgi:hypothetical protein